jgi:hypothetical protein
VTRFKPQVRQVLLVGYKLFESDHALVKASLSFVLVGLNPSWCSVPDVGNLFRIEATLHKTDSVKPTISIIRHGNHITLPSLQQLRQLQRSCK